MVFGIHAVGIEALEKGHVGVGRQATMRNSAAPLRTLAHRAMERHVALCDRATMGVNHRARFLEVRRAGEADDTWVRSSPTRTFEEHDQRDVLSLGRFGRCRRPIQASAARCVATSSTSGSRVSLHHWPTNVTMPISACV